jgi:two-component system sensor histidine kinase VicK
MNELLQSTNYTMALATGKGDDDNFLRINDKVYFDYAISKGDFIFYFRYDREEWKGTISQFNYIVQLSLLGAVCISVIIGYFLSRTITTPIEDLMHRARRIASGDFGEVLEVRSDDEIGKLTHAFNYMSRELKKTLGEISREKNKIETILKYLTDGVVAFNQKGEIIHVNIIAKKLLAVKEFYMSFDEFSECYDLGITLEEIMKGVIPSNRSIDISVNERVVKVYFAFFTDIDKTMDGIICVLHDVTEEKRVENLQREFVANVSHELKTPLATIKSYTETLLEGGVNEETRVTFLNIINSESDRMTRIVRDLLQLSRIDGKRMEWSVEKNDIKVLIKDAIEKIKLEARKKRIKLNYDFAEGILSINCDKHRILQVIINIIGNAIKYTSRGGKVTIETGILDKNVFIRVKDTGIGIPEESIGRIFERFYRVDKARTREMGGTGLGLSIAKEIIEAHGGNISAASNKGEGTQILVMLPLSQDVIEN